MPGARRSAATISSASRLRSPTRRRPRACCSSCGTTRGEVRVCRNALRPGVAPAAPMAKRFPHGRIKLGAAARLYPVKGLAIVLHAVASLRAQRPSLDVELHVAGAGPELAAPARVGRRLGIAGPRDVSWRRRRHGSVLRRYRLSVAHADHGSVRPRRDRGGGARLPRRRGPCRRVGRGGCGRRQRPHDPADVAAVALRRARRRGSRACRSASTTPRPMRSSSLAPSIPSVWPRKSPPYSRTHAASRRCSAAASAHVLAQPSFAAHVRDVLAVIDGYARRS